jgi:hypothetical protein
MVGDPPVVRRLVFNGMTSTGGHPGFEIMSARGLARHYAMLANWGELDGVRIPPESRIRAGMELQSLEFDMIYHPCVARWAIAAAAPPARWPVRTRSAMSAAAGFGYSDPDRHLGIAFAKNYYLRDRRRPAVSRRPTAAARGVCDDCGRRVRRPRPRALEHLRCLPCSSS